MAKDILVNTNTGDFLVPERDSKGSYWDVVWGKLFENDTIEYMNIVVPDWYLSSIRYTDDEYVCLIHADYYPVESAFQTRFVVSYSDGYVDAIELDNDIISPVSVVYIPNDLGQLITLSASQLPMISVNGYFKLLFRRYLNSNYEHAILYQSEDLDFDIGESDNQSAQLLARCAPGSYYRFPGLGVDLTKYINSVVDHTVLTQSLVDEFKSDYKTIIEAEFNNANGDLNVVFSGTREANDTNLADPDLLDIDLFKLSDDEYIRTMALSIIGTVEGNGKYIIDVLSQYNFAGIWDVGRKCKLTNLSTLAVHKSAFIAESGEIKTDENVGQYIAESKVEGGKLYAFEYLANNAGIISGYTTDSEGRRTPWYYQASSLLTTLTDPQYVHPLVNTTSSDNYNCILNDLQIKRRCFIPLQDMKIAYPIGGNSSIPPSDDIGIREIANIAGNYKSLLALFVHPVTSKLFGVVPSDSEILSVLIDSKTNRLLVIK